MSLTKFVSEEGPLMNIFEIKCSKFEKDYTKLNVDKNSTIYCCECESFYWQQCYKLYNNEYNKFWNIDNFDYISKNHLKNY